MPVSVRDGLVAAMAARGGAEARVTGVRSRPWASATFAGARHRLEIRLPAGQVPAFVEGLSEAEFGLRGHLVADIAVTGRRVGGDETVLEVEALTIEES